MNDHDLTFSDLRCKDLVSAGDGKKIGKICDLVLDPEGRIKGLVAPYGKKSWLGKGQDLFIPWRCIVKLGEDVILVDLRCEPPPPPPPPPAGIGIICSPQAKEPDQAPEKPDCDRKCEKCMLFDCAYRWKDV